MESNRRHFLAILTGASLASASCSRVEESASPAPAPEAAADLSRALRELNQAAGIGITDEDFELAQDYAVGAYREAAARLRPIVLDESLDLPVVFAAKRGGGDARR